MIRYVRIALVAATAAASLGFATPALAHDCLYDVEDYPITACVTCEHAVEHLGLERHLGQGPVECDPLD